MFSFSFFMWGKRFDEIFDLLILIHIEINKFTIFEIMIGLMNKLFLLDGLLW